MTTLNPAGREQEPELKSLSAEACRRYRQERFNASLRAVVATGSSLVNSRHLKESRKYLSRLAVARHRSSGSIVLSLPLVLPCSIEMESFEMDEGQGPRLPVQQAMSEYPLSAGCSSTPAKDAVLPPAGASKPVAGEEVALHRKAGGYRSGGTRALSAHRSIRHPSTNPQITPTPPKSAGLVFWATCRRQATTAPQPIEEVLYNLESALPSWIGPFVLAGVQAKWTVPLLTEIANGTRIIRTTKMLGRLGDAATARAEGFTPEWHLPVRVAVRSRALLVHNAILCTEPYLR
jgi:hypothetical protein